MEMDEEIEDWEINRCRFSFHISSLDDRSSIFQLPQMIPLSRLQGFSLMANLEYQELDFTYVTIVPEVGQ
jgi:hypothetical protein